MQHLQSLSNRNFEREHFILSNIPDIFRILIYFQIIIDFITNLSSEYQGFYDLDYVILLLLPYSIILIYFM